MTLRIERSARQKFTVFTLSGRMEGEHVAELKELFDGDYRNIILDLRELRLADRDAVMFLRATAVEALEAGSLRTRRTTRYRERTTDEGQLFCEGAGLDAISQQKG